MPGSRIELATLPTPLEPAPRLTEAWSRDGRGPRIWIKRDDLAGFELSANKVRKLEFHLGAAVESGASTVITCGAAQSNHCRATALAAGRLGYGVTTNDELAMQVEATRLTGLIWDPTYTGKAIVGLRHEIASGGLGPDTDVVFWHTGGGFATFAHDWERVLESN